MSSEILNQLGLDPAILVVILAALVLILTIVVIVMVVRMEKVYRRYDFFMRGKDAETLEDKIAEIYETMYKLQDEDMANRDVMKVINRNMTNSIQKTGMVKYNAFDGMGGQSSFALALLDSTGSGYLLNAMHSRTACYVYIKTVENGAPESSLSNEEKQALEMALKN